MLNTTGRRCLGLLLIGVVPVLVTGCMTVNTRDGVTYHLIVGVGIVRTKRKLRACHRGEVDAAITAAGVPSFADVVELRATTEQVQQIVDATASLASCTP